MLELLDDDPKFKTEKKTNEIKKVASVRNEKVIQKAINEELALVDKLLDDGIENDNDFEWGKPQSFIVG